MARRVFFSFHYDEDIWRVNQIRHSWVTKDWESNTPVDHASWEAIKRKGDEAVKSWIDNQLKGAGVTVVLIGSQTASRKFVRYEIHQSVKLNKGLLGIRIHKLKDRDKKTSVRGINPLTNITKTVPGFLGLWTTRKRLSEIFKTYDWVDDDGYRYFTRWVEEAAAIAGR